jgi:uncharacterized phage protein gp47/JayE
MPFFKKDYADMVTRGLQVLRDKSGITQLSPGAKARMILDAVYQEEYNQHTLFDSNLMQAFLRYCEDKFLDFFGDMLNILRFEATTAISTTEHNNFMFYVDSGTFGDINSGVDFIIPSGRTVSTIEFPVETPTYAEAQGIDRQTIIQYDTTTDTICRADSSFVYADIRARVEGRNSNVPRSVLRRHNFTSYTLSSNELLKCTNKYAISSGRPRESDDAYRYRLMNSRKARERANKIAIRLAALSVPGVADVSHVNYEQGPGTASIYILSFVPTTSPTLVDQVQVAIDQVAANGTRQYALAPQPLGLEFVISVNWRSGTTETAKGNTYASIRNTIERTLNGLTIGQELDLVDLAAIVSRSTNNILTIGLQRPGYFEEVYVYRNSPDGAGVRKSLYSGDYIKPLYNERIMLETSTRYRGVQFL